MQETNERCEVLIIGAGPAGAVAAALVRKQGRQVVVIEREQFPRFSIGESLLPQSMEYLEQAGMLRVVVEAGFQYKNGAAFSLWRSAARNPISVINFRKAGAPPYQVQRARFDHLLATEARNARAQRSAIAIRWFGIDDWHSCRLRDLRQTCRRQRILHRGRASCSMPAASAVSCRVCCNWKRRRIFRFAARSLLMWKTAFPWSGTIETRYA